MIYEDFVTGLFVTKLSCSL